MMIELTTEVINTAALRSAVTEPAHGAVVVFHGVTRNTFEGRDVLRLEYEAYPELALAEMQTIVTEIQERWTGSQVAMVHRIGVVPVNEASVVIAVSTAHRSAAFEAARFAIDQLKARVPIWKKEIYADGSAWKTNANS